MNKKIIANRLESNPVYEKEIDLGRNKGSIYVRIEAKTIFIRVPAIGGSPEFEKELRIYRSDADAIEKLKSLLNKTILEKRPAALLIRPLHQWVQAHEERQPSFFEALKEHLTDENGNYRLIEVFKRIDPESWFQAEQLFFKCRHISEHYSEMEIEIIRSIEQELLAYHREDRAQNTGSIKLSDKLEEIVGLIESSSIQKAQSDSIPLREALHSLLSNNRRERGYDYRLIPYANTNHYDHCLGDLAQCIFNICTKRKDLVIRLISGENVEKEIDSLLNSELGKPETCSISDFLERNLEVNISRIEARDATNLLSLIKKICYINQDLGSTFNILSDDKNKLLFFALSQIIQFDLNSFILAFTAGAPGRERSRHYYGQCGMEMPNRAYAAIQKYKSNSSIKTIYDLLQKLKNECMRKAFISIVIGGRSSENTFAELQWETYCALEQPYAMHERPTMERWADAFFSAAALPNILKELLEYFENIIRRQAESSAAITSEKKYIDDLIEKTYGEDSKMTLISLSQKNTLVSILEKMEWIKTPHSIDGVMFKYEKIILYILTLQKMTPLEFELEVDLENPIEKKAFDRLKLEITQSLVKFCNEKINHLTDVLLNFIRTKKITDLDIIILQQKGVALDLWGNYGLFTNLAMTNVLGFARLKILRERGLKLCHLQKFLMYSAQRSQFTSQDLIELRQSGIRLNHSELVSKELAVFRNLTVRDILNMQKAGIEFGSLKLVLDLLAHQNKLTVQDIKDLNTSGLKVGNLKNTLTVLASTQKLTVQDIKDLSTIGLRLGNLNKTLAALAANNKLTAQDILDLQEQGLKCGDLSEILEPLARQRKLTAQNILDMKDHDLCLNNLGSTLEQLALQEKLTVQDILNINEKGIRVGDLAEVLKILANQKIITVQNIIELTEKGFIISDLEYVLDRLADQDKLGITELRALQKTGIRIEAFGSFGTFIKLENHSPLTAQDKKNLKEKGMQFGSLFHHLDYALKEFADLTTQDIIDFKKMGAAMSDLRTGIELLKSRFELTIPKIKKLKEEDIELGCITAVLENLVDRRMLRPKDLEDLKKMDIELGDIGPILVRLANQNILTVETIMALEKRNVGSAFLQSILVKLLRQGKLTVQNIIDLKDKVRKLPILGFILENLVDRRMLRPKDLEDLKKMDIELGEIGPILLKLANQNILTVETIMALEKRNIKLTDLHLILSKLSEQGKLTVQNIIDLKNKGLRLVILSSILNNLVSQEKVTGQDLINLKNNGLPVHNLPTIFEKLEIQKRLSAQNILDLAEEKLTFNGLTHIYNPSTDDFNTMTVESLKKLKTIGVTVRPLELVLYRLAQDHKLTFEELLELEEMGFELKNLVSTLTVLAKQEKSKKIFIHAIHHRYIALFRLFTKSSRNRFKSQRRRNDHCKSSRRPNPTKPRL